MKKPISATLNARWSELLDKHESANTASSGIRWSYHLTPPFPSSWPLEPGSRLCIYAYGIGHDFSGTLVDAVQIAAPWARLEKYLPDLAPVKVKFMAKEIRPVGIQKGHSQATSGAVIGVGQPIDVYLQAAMLQEYGQDDAAIIRDYYLPWIEQNGVIAKAVRRYHKSFFAWLE